MPVSGDPRPHRPPPPLPPQAQPTGLSSFAHPFSCPGDGLEQHKEPQGARSAVPAVTTGRQGWGPPQALSLSPLGGCLEGAGFICCPELRGSQPCPSAWGAGVRGLDGGQNAKGQERS